jgi:hypothetical protein
MSDEADALQFLHRLASAIEQHHGPCKVERALFLIWLEDMVRSGLATGADEEAVVAAIFKIYPSWQVDLGKAR